MRRFSLHTLVIVALVALGGGVADASPPTGQLSFTDHRRGQVAEGGQVGTPGGSQAFYATYTLGPGASTGWRALPGAAVLLVTEGTAMVHGAEGCTVQEVGAGRAAVLPAGTVALHNNGSAPLSVFAALFALPVASADPLNGPPSGQAPPGCGVPSGAALPGRQMARGTFLRADNYSGHGMQRSEVNGLEPGSDVLVSSYELAPGASSGWINHRGQFGIITAGTLTYYEGHDGECHRTDSYSAGQAFVHLPHHHLAVNEGERPMKLVLLHFNVPHNASPAPVVGNQADAFDFTPLPPADCPRLN